MSSIYISEGIRYLHFVKTTYFLRENSVFSYRSAGISKYAKDLRLKSDYLSDFQFDKTDFSCLIFKANRNWRVENSIPICLKQCLILQKQCITGQNPWVIRQGLRVIGLSLRDIWPSLRVIWPDLRDSSVRLKRKSNNA